MTPVTAWLTAAMVSWVPAHQGPRYASIADDALAVATDGPLFGGPLGAERTALFMLSIASYESGFHPLVDSGRWRGDGGRSWCLMQINIGAYRTAEGWSGRDLVSHRRRCFTAALRALRDSVAMCKSMHGADAFSAYAHGRCLRGSRAMRARLGRAQAWEQSRAIPAVTGGGA